MTAENIKPVSKGVRLETIVKQLKRISANRKVLVATLILGSLVAMSLVGPFLTPFEPTETHPADRYASPNSEYLFGTDDVGRDLLSRVLVGGRTTLFLGVAATMLAMLIGIPIGLAAGYQGGRIDEVLMRLMDILMSFPTLLLALLLLTALSSNIWNALAAIGIVFAPKIARIVRSSTLSVKNEEYIQAAKVRGESDLYIMFNEILPNIAAPIVVEGSIRVGYAIIIGASLSFLGLGTQPPAADWGYMVAQAIDHIWYTPWFLVWPSLFLGLTIFSFNLLGDGIRDLLDPKVTGDEL